ncbi:YihY/virulence factor BrkB family protein [Pseudoroseicyclus aestuarii]|uniref:Membrane protein n=1 Tax=Pseudoroseicyclus aestuarii TaxID=1795041 RepID=A0A318T207_9RHOB|nr:YihY/virulence factor BrkB family protein [Pseudoroseicyclus aestuarii]PYE86017.1 membrane protein [Pseudoroseicyclus aestuarii]
MTDSASERRERIGVIFRTRRVVMGVVGLIGDVQLGLIAAGVAFYSIFAVFPAIAAMISVFGLLADPAVIEEQLQMMQELIPAEAYLLLADQVRALVTAETGALGLTTLISIGVALFSARNGVASLILGLNQIHDRPNRGGIRHIVVAITLTATLILIAIVALLVIVVAPLALAVVPLGPFATLLLEVLRWLIALAVVLAALGVIYRFGPNMRGSRGAWLTPGALLVVVLWLAASAGFSFYLTNFGSYNEVYGSLGAAVAMLMWLYISAFLVLLGAAVNVVLRRERRRLRQA